MTMYGSQQLSAPVSAPKKNVMDLAQEYWWVILLAIVLGWYLMNRKSQKKKTEEETE